MIAQINKHESAVVADAMAPAGEPDGGAVFREAKRAAGVGAITVHDCRSFSLRSAFRAPNRKSGKGKARSQHGRRVVGRRRKGLIGQAGVLRLWYRLSVAVLQVVLQAGATAS